MCRALLLLIYFVILENDIIEIGIITLEQNLC